MQIVIDISKSDYEYIKKLSKTGVGECLIDNVYEGIRKGIVLPKGHGRLKDVDAFISKAKADRVHSAYVRSWTADDVLSALDNSYAPTIIETDREKQNGERNI